MFPLKTVQGVAASVVVSLLASVMLWEGVGSRASRADYRAVWTFATDRRIVTSRP